MRVTAPPLLAACPQCHEARILRDLVAAFVHDCAAQRLLAPCMLTPGCAGRLHAIEPPGPIHDRPPAARGGRHVTACTGCQSPLLLEYLYGYSNERAPVPCPRCGHDLFPEAVQEWPRAENGAAPFDLRVRLVVASPAAKPPAVAIERAPAPALHPILDATVKIF